MIALVDILLVIFENLGGLFYFTRKIKKREDGADQDSSKLLCRFVTDGTGKKLGESISLSDDIIIIKSKGKFLGVPLKHIEENGKSILVKGLIDFDKSYEMGEKWRKESFREIKQKDESSEI